MHNRFAIGTAMVLILSTAALAQAPNDSSRSTTQQPRANTTNSSGTTSGSTTAPSTNQSAPAAAAPATRGSAQSTQPATGATTTQNQQSSGGSAAQAPATSRTTQTPATSGTAQTQPSQPASPSSAQSAPSTQQPATNQAQTPQRNQPAANSAQSPAPAGSTSTNNAQAPSTNTNTNVSANVSVQQQTRISQSIARLNVQPLSNVNFSVAVGTVIPRNVRLQTLPPDIVQFVPQYRGYNFVVVRDEIVIVEPSTSRIVSVLPRSGSRVATTKSRVKFSDKERAVIRQHARSSREGVTTGSTARAQMRAGDRVPDTVEVREFPETIYREVPTVRQYRYIDMDNRSYLIEPRERVIIEEID
jgi:hypothetical protein